MINGYDIAYAAGVAAAAPFWMARRKSREKVLCALGQRMGHVRPREGDGPAVLIHAVSLGEVNATVELVRQLRAARPDVAAVVSTTTDAGYARGRQLYPVDGGVQLIRFPLDFSVAVNHLLDAVRPSVAVLMEGELWPNFLLQCERRGTPVLLVNGRVTPSSFRNYRRLPSVTTPMLRRLSAVCVQDAGYAEQFRQLGAPAERVAVTGTMKFDTALVADRAPGDTALAAAVGLTDGDPVWVCGSTGPGEEPVVLDVFADLKSEISNLRLVIVPRHPQRFDEVAALITSRGHPLLRRSTGIATGDRPVILGDTMGELRTFYGLATVAFVGRSLLDLGHRQRGSDMIEPAALGKPVVVGRWTQNFADAVRAFRSADAIAEVTDGSELTAVLRRWLSDPPAAAEVGRRAQAVVRERRGATARHVARILACLGS
jgi:3-deoxy-D-manno-octulosonic-acid transferase